MILSWRLLFPSFSLVCLSVRKSTWFGHESPLGEDGPSILSTTHNYCWQKKSVLTTNRRTSQQRSSRISNCSTAPTANSWNRFKNQDEKWCRELTFPIKKGWTLLTSCFTINQDIAHVKLPAKEKKAFRFRILRYWYYRVEEMLREPTCQYPFCVTGTYVCSPL